MTDEMPAAVEIKAHPLIKWPGGKREVLRCILPILPKSANRYFEPFVGGGAVFFATQPRHATLSDSNEELINLYKQVRDEPERLIKVLRTFENKESSYYKIRAQSFRSPIKRAARLLYLTTLSFNGIHRVNLNGEFNVPYGHKTHLLTCDEDHLRAISRALAYATLLTADFEAATAKAKAGDVVYFDPPYTVAHANNGFIKYNEKIFSWDDQVRLAHHANLLSDRGCHVIISNADHYSIRKLYRNFEQSRVQRFSRIAASAMYRRTITECVFYALGDRDA